ncbi:2-succinyl-5-enolpyruvyl-6-hydroxy-3-cyclohexene-1-carboxylate synthase [Vibrio chagasii]|uniref:2-succinyl-5-enolpyruvyl-6-hydroxy-3- cyclohexene-1-carboxylic-acid synthase n=1 Tax=Vibrio chagasii TaxID=170679 RepID=UPI001641B123|nr:2-succinyl-5-enolpyruvyl-6-hydroxy-3-cyclohexene-1-carboxylic-acid synthase [Vibrio chagasii]MCG9567382.1 2-succinyl-5-enolpyruvyl-6-hydroxy-3-cyclohexene-1-carboxylic-acid synthase [Vibrio chagasii]CAH6811256.1 2-succinyl-5-enolpyruvyl-6-hydroxy-3-cyclohexene-1-carboxylate synthase [Vibrio chagasii]CAH6818183.1 2-succinyl-5-enolpyruvyl-6-hydroxy-3-cyclohexene-1-carboxylate synthase [Vibrio chagasii]CAH6820697.1 2-succinyl-5-enolpyruvyl-6-hydroxy-3-cyclohexene-1-carboxylate synthase [Vibrio 
MNHDQAVLNRVWCHTLLEELTRSGVEHVCIAPGSRSTPLTLEAEANSKLTLHTHFDERGLGFLALGLAKASNKPVAVIVTSGTAVANLLPATAESGLTREKLILLTSDRPIDLVDCGANQAIQQQGIFSSHVETALNLPSPTTQVSLNWLLTSIDHALAKQRSVGGAIHINCPFPEPLYSANSAEMYADYTKSVAAWRASTSLYSNTYLPSHLNAQPVSASDYVARKGAVVIGSIENEAAIKAKQFASALGWPVFCDPQSGVSSDWKHYDLWMQSDAAKAQLSQCDFIIQFGERIVSKRLNQWVKGQAATFCSSQYIVVSPDAHRINQDHLPQTHIVADIEYWLSEQHLPTLLGEHAGWAAPLAEVANTVQQLALAQISNNDQLTELSVAVDLSSRLKGRELFVGNSLMVRLVDMLSSISATQVYSNRGASGIDGLVATAAGVIKANQNPLMMLIGDTSLLYDLNSLALLTHNTTPMVIVVTNNDGGAIFDLLPVPEQQKQSLYQMPHGFSFEHAAAQFQLGYAAPETLNCYQTLIEQHFEQGQGTLLVEVKTPPEQASTLLKQFSSMLTEALA